MNKSHSKILEDDISPWDGSLWKTEDVLDAMDKAAKQAYEAGKKYNSIKVVPEMLELKFKYNTYEDYLKQLE